MKRNDLMINQLNWFNDSKGFSKAHATDHLVTCPMIDLPGDHLVCSGLIWSGHRPTFKLAI